MFRRTWLYFSGNGIERDSVAAYAWFSISFANNNDAVTKRNKDIVAEKMTPEQIIEAKALTREMIEKSPKLIQKK